MYQLAIECSGLYGSVALLSANHTIESIGLPQDRSSVQSLAVTVKALLSQHRISPHFISITQGPGSFTGLRVGLTTAKMLGLAWQVPLVAVSTLEVLAHQILHRRPKHHPAIVVPVINAFRRQVFTASWLSSLDNTISPIFPTQVVDAVTWQARPLTSQSAAPQPANATSFAAEGTASANVILVGGPGLESYRPGRICLGRGLPVQLVEELHPEAAWVGQLGWKRFQEGLIESPNSLTANYVRASAAEDQLRQ